MDALSDVLRTTRLKGGVFLHAEFADPWCLAVAVRPEACAPFVGEVSEVIPYHYVVDGCLRIRCRDEVVHELGPGDLALFPYNDYHLLGGDVTLPPIPSETVVQRSAAGGLAKIRLGGDGPITRIVCGCLAGERLEANPVVSTLPAVLRLSYSEGSSAQWMRSTFRYAADEIAGGRMGSETVFAKLSELLFVEAVRRYAETLPDEQTGWLAGLKDPYVSRALALIHARVHEAWTVDGLGREIGLSRSALADRFTRIIGLPPMQYLTQWRMQVAAQALVNSAKSIPQIAGEVGYESEASLTRAFKRAMGVPPATWRRRQQLGAAGPAAGG